MNVNVIRNMQLEKVKGELRTLKASYYNHMGDNVVYDAVSKIIDNIISELDNELG